MNAQTLLASLLSATLLGSSATAHAQNPADGAQASPRRDRDDTAQDPDEHPAVIADYQPGEPIPPGYRVQRHARTGLVIAGTASVAASYLVGLPFALSQDSTGYHPWSALAIPVAGPVIALAQPDGTHGETYVQAGTLGRVFFAVDALAQVVGVVMLGYGLASPRSVLVREPVARVQLRPTPMFLGNGTAGAGLVGTF
jgi:hypothetical protein